MLSNNCNKIYLSSIVCEKLFSPHFHTRPGPVLSESFPGVHSDQNFSRGPVSPTCPRTWSAIGPSKNCVSIFFTRLLHRPVLSTAPMAPVPLCGPDRSEYAFLFRMQGRVPGKFHMSPRMWWYSAGGLHTTQLISDKLRELTCHEPRLYKRRCTSSRMLRAPCAVAYPPHLCVCVCVGCVGICLCVFVHCNSAPCVCVAHARELLADKSWQIRFDAPITSQNPHTHVHAHNTHLHRCVCFHTVCERGRKTATKEREREKERERGEKRKRQREREREFILKMSTNIP